ncbi:MAG: nucleotidyltransferase domain-containing protein [Spirochaetales bacterium]|nr:nucleotidyltransferase domain-containing protein [Spirochaetales bacterium]
MKSDSIADKIKSLVKNNDRFTLVELYGSAATGRMNEQSDIDIAVGSDSGLTNDDCLSLSLQLSELFNREVSVINLEKMEGLILSEVLTKGITIKNSSPLYKSRHLIRMYEYNEDILPFQQLAFEKKRQRYLNG